MRLGIGRGVVGALAILVLAGGTARAAIITVPGTADPWLAGMPAGSTASSGDTAPAESPVEVLDPGVNVSLGGVLRFAARGSVGFCSGCSSPTPDGDGGLYPHQDGAQNGIGSIISPANALIGVFLTSAQPDLSPAPGLLDFGLIGLGFSTLSPVVQQPFFIGDGLTGTGSGSVQSFVIPTGATRLFLGTMDGYGWYNNVGALEVEVTQSAPPAVPEPASIALLGTGLAGLGLRRRRSS